MKNKNSRKRGAAIELAILALALAAIFGTVATSVMLTEAKCIKIDKDELKETYERLEIEKKVKDRIRHTLDVGGELNTNTLGTDGIADIKPHISDDKNSCTIIDWKWVEEVEEYEKQD